MFSAVLDIQGGKRPPVKWRVNAVQCGRQSQRNRDEAIGVSVRRLTRRERQSGSGPGVDERRPMLKTVQVHDESMNGGPWPAADARRTLAVKPYDDKFVVGIVLARHMADGSSVLGTFL